MIVTVVYSEVALETPPYDPCPGRVAPSWEEQDQITRKISISYYSVVIFFTVLIAALFFLTSVRLFRKTSEGVSDIRKFIMQIGSLIVSTFLLRSIFFIIILAVNFSSSVYIFVVLLITEVLLIFFLMILMTMQRLKVADYYTSATQSPSPSSQAFVSQ